MAVSANQIQQLYVAYFGRPADPVGLASWLAQATSQSASGVSDSAILDSFSVQFAAAPEYTANFTGMTDAQKVNQVYNNLFSHDADLTGLIYWATKLTKLKMVCLVLLAHKKLAVFAM